MSRVLVVLTNWCRPGNLPRIIDAFRAQTVAVDLVCVDNSRHGLQSDLGIETWRIPRNLGPPCRFTAAAADTEHHYFLFYDDDMLPGRRAVEGLLAKAVECDGLFSTIGQVGRRFASKTGRFYRYRRLNSPRLRNDLSPCDMTCRAHFVERSAVMRALMFRNLLLTHYGLACSTHVAIHDDVLLCLGNQLATGLPSYIVPAWNREFNLNVEELDDTGAINHIRPTHMRERDALINWAYDLGWRSLWQDRWKQMLSVLPLAALEEIR